MTEMGFSSFPRVIVNLAVKTYIPYLLEKGFLDMSRLETLQDIFRLKEPLITATSSLLRFQTE